MRDKLASAIAIARGIAHERILPLFLASSYGCFRIFVTPLMPYGNLLAYVSDNPTANRYRLLADVAEGLIFLHSQVYISHGDLRPSKLLISESGNAVISGFSSSAITSQCSSYPQTPVMGNHIIKCPRYAAPERRLQQSAASDVYSFCMIIFEALTLTQIRIDASDEDMVIETYSLEGRPMRTISPRELIHKELFDLLLQGWSDAPLSRPTSSRILRMLLRMTEDSNRPAVRQSSPCASEPDYVCNAWRRLLREGTEWTQEQPASSPVPPAYTPAYVTVGDTGSCTVASLHTGATQEDLSLSSSHLPSEAAVSPTQIFTTQFAFRGSTVYIDIPVKTTLYHSRLNSVLIGHAAIEGRKRVLAVKVRQQLDEHSEKMYKRELHMWQILEHPRILPFYGFCPMNDGSGRSGLISPFMRNGTLSDYLARNPAADRLELMCDVAEGVMYLHNNALVVHGDLKPANILIDDHERAVLADFGLSTTIQSRDDVTDEIFRLSYTVAYCAPELACDQAVYPSAPGLLRSKTTMTDVWAFGMVLYVTFGGTLTGSSWDLLSRMEQGVLPPEPPQRHPIRYVCDQAWSLCKQCWARCPDSRPNMKDAHGTLRTLCPPKSARV